VGVDEDEVAEECQWKKKTDCDIVCKAVDPECTSLQAGFVVAGAQELGCWCGVAVFVKSMKLACSGS